MVPYPSASEAPMSDENDNNSDELPPPSVEVAEQRADGSVHVVLSIATPADEDPPTPEPSPSSSGSKTGKVVSGAGKVAGKVLGGLWDVIKPSGGEGPAGG
jgi:hypothetical protein